MKLKLGPKLIGAFSVVAAICAVVGFIGFYAMNNANSSIDELADVRMPSIQSLQVIQDCASVIEGSIKAMCNPKLTQAEIDHEIEAIDEARDRYEEAWAVYEPLPQTEEEAKVWSEFKSAWNQWRTDNNEFMTMRDELERLGIHDPTKLRQMVERFTKDHHALMSALGKGILNSEAVQVQEDPTKCAFGKWMSEYTASSSEIRKQIDEIKRYHDDFHEKAGKIENILARDRSGAALSQAKNIYANDVTPAAEKVFDRFERINDEVAKAENLYNRMQTQAMEVNAESAKRAIALLGDIVKINEEVGHAAATESKSMAASMKTIIVISILLGIVVAVGFGIFIARSIARPISAMATAAEEIAHGNVNQSIEVKSEDEVGQLADAFRNMVDYMKDLATAAGQIASNNLDVVIKPRSANDVLGTAFSKMVSNLSSMVRQLTDNATQLVSAATEIASSSEEMSRGSAQQADQVNQVSTAVEEMAATIVQSSKNAGDASDAAQQASDTAGQGGKIVGDTISGMQMIAQVVRDSATSISKLEQSADQIGEIIGVIDDIADQTNLLALNAAIEAARAGEQGRGFAVVADEVRKLAERTGKATGEITEMIKGIQGETSEAVTSMESGISQVDQGRELADQAGTSLNEIVNMSSRVMDMIQQIATASEEQSSAAEQISRSIQHISNITNETASGAEQSAAAAEQLNRQAEDLRVLVGRFKISGGNLGIIDLAKSDHATYVNKLSDIVDGRRSSESWKTIDHKNCRFGKWYYSEGSAEYSAMSEFRDIENPHVEVHKLANEAIKAYVSGDEETARRLFDQSHRASEEVIRDLDTLKAHISESLAARA